MLRRDGREALRSLSLSALKMSEGRENEYEKKRKKRKQAREERKNKIQKKMRDGKAAGECLREHRCPLDSACVVFYQGSSLFKGGIL